MTDMAQKRKISVTLDDELVAVLGDSRLKHWSQVTFVCFSPDGKVLASASDDRTIVLWDVRTGRAMKTLRGHTDFVGCVEFSPDGKLLASCSGNHHGSNNTDNHTIKLWDAKSGKLKQIHKGGHYASVRQLA